MGQTIGMHTQQMHKDTCGILPKVDLVQTIGKGKFALKPPPSNIFKSAYLCYWVCIYVICNVANLCSSGFLKQGLLGSTCLLHLVCVFIPSPVKVGTLLMEVPGIPIGASFFKFELNPTRRDCADLTQHEFQYHIVKTMKNPSLKTGLEWSAYHCTTSHCEAGTTSDVLHNHYQMWLSSAKHKNIQCALPRNPSVATLAQKRLSLKCSAWKGFKVW